MTTAEKTRVESTFSALAVTPVEEAGKTFSGAEWHVRIIDAGLSLNGRTYPLDILHRDVKIFEGVPVHAAFGPDHSMGERGVRSIVGYVKNPVPVPEGVDGILHISDVSLRPILLDLFNENVLEGMIGVSIAAEGIWEIDYSKNPVMETATELTKAQSVDLVREPAAGGKILKVTESSESGQREGKSMPEVTMTAEELSTLVKDAAATAVKESEERAEAKAKEEAEAKAEADKVAAEAADEDEKKKAKAKADAEKDDATKAKEAEEKAASEALNSHPVVTQMAEMLLSQAMTEAKLPETAEKRIRTTFEGKPFDAKAVTEAVNAEKDYLASIQKVQVENLTRERRLVGMVTVDETDKLLGRIDGMFTEEGFVMVEGEKVQGFRSWTEAYCTWTGEHPVNVDKEEIWQEWYRGSTGYSSANKKAVEKIYSEALLQQSTWGEVTADRIHKAMILNYNLYPQYQDWRKIASVIPVSDYQAHRQIKTGGYANFPVVVEGGTYPDATHFGDEETTVTMRKLGNIVPQITRELIINDNVGAVARIPIELGRTAARTLYQDVFDLLRDNATYGVDSTTLFHTNHANTGTTALSLTGINDAVVAMRSQTRALATNDVLGGENMPTKLVVPNELQGLADRIANPSDQVWTQLSADTDADQDVRRWAGKFEVIVLDYATDATEYYFVADPNFVKGIGVAFLNGKEEPDLFMQANENVGEMFTMDVQNVKIRQEFRSVIMDYRPFYRQT